MQTGAKQVKPGSKISETLFSRTEAFYQTCFLQFTFNKAFCLWKHRAHTKNLWPKEMQHLHNCSCQLPKRNNSNWVTSLVSVIYFAYNAFRSQRHWGETRLGRVEHKIPYIHDHRDDPSLWSIYDTTDVHRHWPDASTCYIKTSMSKLQMALEMQSLFPAKLSSALWKLLGTMTTSSLQKAPLMGNEHHCRASIMGHGRPGSPRRWKQASQHHISISAVPGRWGFYRALRHTYYIHSMFLLSKARNFPAHLILDVLFPHLKLPTEKEERKRGKKKNQPKKPLLLKPDLHATEETFHYISSPHDRRWARGWERTHILAVLVEETQELLSIWLTCGCWRSHGISGNSSSALATVQLQWSLDCSQGANYTVSPHLQHPSLPRPGQNIARCGWTRGKEIAAHQPFWKDAVCHEA